ncbi:phasin family protein [Microvirga aerophila]|uniref:phasin family protein n=1 Tax=Microvirga aerophila TaxID=670291 RepID=UPI001479571E|nr:phasin family protein [Microvirga aerophila]
MAQRTTDQVTEAFGAARLRTQHLIERATQNLQAVTQSSAILAGGIQEASGECLKMVQERMHKNLEGVKALVRCRTLSEFLAVQSSLLRDNLELTLTNSRRIAGLSARVTDNATRTATAQIERSASRAA